MTACFLRLSKISDPVRDFHQHLLLLQPNRENRTENKGIDFIIALFFFDGTSHLHCFFVARHRTLCRFESPQLLLMETTQ